MRRGAWCARSKNKALATGQDEAVRAQGSAPGKHRAFFIFLSIQRLSHFKGQRLLRDGQLVRIREMVRKRERRLQQRRLREQEKDGDTVGMYDQTMSKSRSKAMSVLKRDARADICR